MTGGDGTPVIVPGPRSRKRAEETEDRAADIMSRVVSRPSSRRCDASGPLGDVNLSPVGNGDRDEEERERMEKRLEEYRAGKTGNHGAVHVPDASATRTSTDAEGTASGLPFTSGRVVEDRKGTWNDTGYRADDAQAHRDRRYRIPSPLVQTLEVFRIQMKLFSKERWTYVMLIAAILIPAVMLIGYDWMTMLGTSMLGNSMEFSNGLIATCLSLMPLMMGLFTSITCGTQIPNEFKNRTAYLNVSLPISRASFFLGKYLAGFLMSLGVFVFAYGMSIAVSMVHYDSVFTDLLSQSLLITVVAVFAYTATAFCIGCFMRRGSSMVPFILLSVVVPAAITGLCSLIHDNTLMLLPSFLCEAAVGLLGGNTVSVGLVASGMMDMTNIWGMVTIGILWGAGFLALGMYKTMRREM